MSVVMLDDERGTRPFKPGRQQKRQGTTMTAFNTRFEAQAHTHGQSWTRGGLLATVLSVVASAMTPASGQVNKPVDNIGHTRHLHHHNPKHPTEAPTPARFVTSRPQNVKLPLPEEKDAFVFVVFGDRTGGPVDGVKVLADAVRDTNMLEPDFVITVGDLINGYVETPQWMEQMREYKGIMDELRSPWFPVAGNHDTYWRNRGGGETKPKDEHDDNYEMHLGPLWYAFEHKNCWFIAIYSDETNPSTGEKNFGKMENHEMSDEQFNWLSETLTKAKGADHVFLFLHHPRWIGGTYGNQWDKVHKLLVDAGNVTAVFGGHIHRMRYDPKDGIEYVTLATVGGGQSGIVPELGWLHHFNIITVRKQQVAMASVPVGEVQNVREISSDLADQGARQQATVPVFARQLQLQPDGGSAMEIRTTIRNTTAHAIEVTASPESADSRWRFTPDHDHAKIEPGQSKDFAFWMNRKPSMLDETFRPVELSVNTDILMPTARYALKETRTMVPVDEASLPAPSTPSEELALHLDGDDAILVPNADVSLPDGPLTLEAWMSARSFNERTGLLCKTEGSDYGIFVNKGVPHFSVWLGTKYETVKGKDALPTGSWAHVAGVFDGGELRLYVDGKLIDSKKAAGVRKVNTLPLVLGADVNKEGQAMSYFDGQLDGVRLSKRAVYAGDNFQPMRRLGADADTVLLSNMDGFFGQSLWGEGPRKLIGKRVGDPAIRPAK
jgi:predicted phosphodiesterase